MKKLIFSLIAAAVATAAFATPPSITRTTVWHDTSFAGPYVISAVIRGDVTFPLSDTLLYYSYNPAPNDPPYTWGSTLPPDSVHGDTMYFHIPVIPMGLETPVKLGYAIWARNTGYDETYSPATGYFHFINTVYTPQYTNTTTLQDTFFNGPFVVSSNITTAYGDSVANDYIYTDMQGGNTYARDSVGADGRYYYAIPRYPGGAQTPIKVFWYLAASDTMGNTASYPLKRDTINHFTFTDPKPSNSNTIANTSQTGPFPVWVNFRAEGPVINDSLWVDNGSGLTAYPRDSVGTTDPTKYYYTIPQQNVPVVTPVTVRWYLKAADSITGNYTYWPETAPSTPYTFYIYDLIPPVFDEVTLMDNVSVPGHGPITAICHDTSGVYQIRLYYRTKPNTDTTWSNLPMFPTGTPHQYRATLPYYDDGTLVQYYVMAYDSAQNEAGTWLRNTATYPAGGQVTPWQFFAGSNPYRLLLVNDELASNSYENTYLAALDTTGVLCGYWDNRKANVLAGLRNFNNLVWFTGEDSVTTLTPTDCDTLADFLDRGGNLLIVSKNLGQNIGASSAFYSDYLKAHYDTSRSTQTSFYVGRNAYPISYGTIDTLLISGSAELTKSIDVIRPLAGADSVFNFRNVTGRCGVVRCSTATFKTVYSTLPIEGLTANTPGRVSATHFLARCLRYFGIAAFYKVEGEPPTASAPEFGLSPAYPNPSRGSTVIAYQLPAPGHVSLRVYNVAGQLVKDLADQQMPAGRHAIKWNGADESGRAVASGLYFYRLVAGERQLTNKVMIIR